MEKNDKKCRIFDTVRLACLIFFSEIIDSEIIKCQTISKKLGDFLF